MTGTSFLLIFLIAFANENAMFSYALGINRMFLHTSKIKRILILGGIFTVVSVLSNIINYGINFLIVGNPYAVYIRTMSQLFIVFIFYVAIYFLVLRFFPAMKLSIFKVLPIALFNTAMFAVFYITYNRNYSLAQTVLYALGSGLGYTAAMITIFYAKKRLYLSNIPKSFRGTPIILIYIGILSLGLYGLLGYGVTA